MTAKASFQLESPGTFGMATALTLKPGTRASRFSSRMVGADSLQVALYRRRTPFRARKVAVACSDN